MTVTSRISGWGGYPKHEAQLLMPPSFSALKAEVQKQKTLIPRGMGRSYGDSANASVVLDTTYCDHFLEFDANVGLLTVEAGITLREILKVIVPKGWFLPVTPGTSYVTLGGAIASDVHGKNHHIAGTFGQHVKSMSVLLGTDDVVTASPEENVDLFQATCGGMGLTGVIITATVQLTPIRSSYINQRAIKTDCIESACEAFEANSNATYSVAWIDCLARGKDLGRSVLMLGEHAVSGGLELNTKDSIAIPIYTPSALLNRMTIKAFNGAYWYKAKHNKTQSVPLMSYFYPLDAIGSWNKFYGKAGFMQFQFVLPKADGVANMRLLLTEIAENGGGSFLAVLKQFGEPNKNLLSFPIEGYTLALDFKMTTETIRLLNKLYNIVSDFGGRIYLTKDALMQEALFKRTYPKWREFELIRQKYGAIGKFSSEQSKRLGLA
jgi:decaprenylphospho-beta-D-ribofuranose 2-oxidase